MKGLFFAILLTLILPCSSVCAETLDFPDTVISAEERLPTAEDYYEEQFQKSGAGELSYSLPEETRESLGGLGVSSPDWQSIQNISAEGIFSQVASVFGEKGQAPLQAAFSVLAVMLLCAVINGMKLSFGDKPLGGAIGLVGVLCVCMAVIRPVVACISSAAQVVEGAAGFLLACVPVLTGILIAGGQTVSAGTYNVLMIGAGNVISVFSAGLLVPLLNVFLAISIASSLSPGLNLSGICSWFAKAVQWGLGLCMTVFTSLLTVQSAVAASADSTASKAAKFLLSSFVPVVGGALGDAFTTVQGSVRLLKSGVGAFALLGTLFLFLPAVAECLLWMLTLNLCGGIGMIFDLKEINSLLSAAAKAVGLTLAVVLCSMAVIMISTALMLVMGGGTS